MVILQEKVMRMVMHQKAVMVTDGDHAGESDDGDNAEGGDGD